jgi:hypothetical protein
MSPVLALACGLLVAGGVHATKALAVRPAVTATTGGAGNVPVSILEDIVSTVVSVLSILLPVIVGTLLVVALALLIWWLWRRMDKSPAS